MKISVQSLNFKLQDTTEQFATRKLETLRKYLPSIREVRLELERQTNRRGEDNAIAQVTVMHERGAILRTEERVDGFERGTLEAAITEATDKMYSRIKRFKGRREARRGRERFSATIEEIEASLETPEGELEDDILEPEVVKRKRVPVSMMSEFEAIEQMELLGHTFFLFRDALSGKVNVIYRRRDAGGYGVLVPQDE